MRCPTAKGWLRCALLLALVAPGASGQPAAGELEELQIDLWPEYDRPDVLVMYKFRLDGARSLDAPVQLPIPASVGEPHAVAWRDAKGSLFVADFTRTVEGERAVVSVRMGSREGQLEFYDRLEKEGTRRTYRFQWPGGAALGALSIRVQRPLGASGLSVEPSPSRQWQGEDGLTYFLVELGPLDATASPAVQVSYDKDSPALSAGDVAPTPATTSSAPAAPAASAPPAESAMTPTWAVALGGLLVASIGGWLLWSSRRPAARTRPPQAGSAPAKAKRGSAVFCHNCGTKAAVDHSFCMSCGTKLITPK